MKGSVCCAQMACCACLCLWATAGWAGDQALIDLLVACHAGDGQAVRARLHEKHELARQAVVTGQSEPRYTALDLATRGGYAEIVRLLLEVGADVNSRSGAAGRTPLIQACLYGSANGAQLPDDLAKALALPELSATAQTEPSLPAVPPCPRDYLYCLCLLIDSGADLDACDKQGRCALYHCAEQGNSEALSLLTEHGAKVEVGPHTKVILSMWPLLQGTCFV